MSVSFGRPSVSKPIWIPVTATGTKTLPSVLEISEWRVITDTVQTFTAAQLLLESATSATQFGIVVRGGIGTVTITEPCDQITLTTGTFPLLLGLQRLS